MSKLTLKQIKFVKHYFETGNASKSALLSGYKQGVSGRENMQNPTILSEIERIKAENGLTEELLLSKHKELLQAKKIQSCMVYVHKDETGKWKVNESKNDFIEVPDLHVQLGALKLAYEIEGRIKKPTIDQHVSFNFNDIKQLVEYAVNPNTSKDTESTNRLAKQPD